MLPNGGCRYVSEDILEGSGPLCLRRVSARMAAVIMPKPVTVFLIGVRSVSE